MCGEYHSFTYLAVCYVLLVHTHPDCPTVHPQIVLFMTHLFVNMFQVVQEHNL